jgi:RNA polymerase sigma-70 factor (ECF subfamily)
VIGIPEFGRGVQILRDISYLRFPSCRDGNILQMMTPIEAARKGNAAAFARLYDEHHVPLFRFAWRLTGSIADAEEIVQECFLSLLRAGCSYDASRTPLRTYLLGNGPQPGVEAISGEGGRRIRRRSRMGARLSSLALQSETADLAAKVISALPDLQREALILAHRI